MDLDQVKQAMKEWVGSDEHKKYIEHLKHVSSIDEKYINMFHTLTPEQRLEIINKIITKYESDDYYWSEIRKGYEPRKPLYYILLDYGRIHGKKSFEGLNEYFPEEKVIIDNHIEVNLIIGQGSFVKINIL